MPRHRPRRPGKRRPFPGIAADLFQWSGEPVGTASRELHLAGLDGSETIIPLDGRFSDTVRVRMSGDFAWVVVFLDADGKPLCTSLAGLLAKGSGGGRVAVGNDSFSGPSSGPGAPAKVAVYMHDGRLVIVLQNSPYAGQYWKLVASDNYDGTNEDLMGAAGIELHANNAANAIIGTPGNDVIHPYAGTDTTDGGAGDDDTYLGSGTKTFVDPATNDVDRYFVPATAVVLGDLRDGDTLDQMYNEAGAGGYWYYDAPPEDISTVVPSVPN